jgi:protein pelota
MKVLKSEKLQVKVLVENLDDLWYLNSIIDAGDVVEGKTLRKIKLGESDDRNQKIVKKPIYLKILVERIEFHPYSNILRVSGKVSEGTDDIPAGSYHTFNVEEQSLITINKKEWLRFQKAKLEEAAKERKPDILILVLDREEAHFALLKKYGYVFLTSLQGNVQKKTDTPQQTSNFYGDCLDTLTEYVDRYSIKRVIVASPAFWKEEFLKNVKDASLKKSIVLATSSSSDRSAINEVLKRDEVKAVLAEARISEELKLVESLLSEISKENLAAYGINEVESAVKAGAVKTLLITDAIIRKLREDDDFGRLDGIMRAADRAQAAIHIVSSEHDGGKKLDGLGGVGALLRYKLNY